MDSSEARATEPEEYPLGFDRAKALVGLIGTTLLSILENWLTGLARARFDTPEHVAWIIVPIALLSGALYVALSFSQPTRARSLLLAFLVAYALGFCVADTTDILEWRRSLSEVDHPAQPLHFGFGTASDWHYWFIPPAKAPHEITVIMVSPEHGRFDFAKLIGWAVAQEAKGVALDVYFKGNNVFDKDLCEQFRSASEHQIPVFVGYQVEALTSHNAQSVQRRGRLPDSLGEDCIPRVLQGHLQAFIDWDGRVRSLPLHLNGDLKLPALSLRVAQWLAGGAEPIGLPPGNDWLQLAAPDNIVRNLAVMDYEELVNDPRNQAILRDQFVLVGEKSERDSFQTPWGKQAGVVVHALAVLSLRHQLFIHRLPSWMLFPLLYSLCLGLALLVERRLPAMTLLLIIGVASFVLLGFAMLSMYAWMAWVDVIYSIASLWILLPLLLYLRSGHPATRASSALVDQ